MKITAEVTKPELDALEHLCICIPLCEKHKQLDLDAPPKDCKKCAKIEREWWGHSFDLWSKLTTAYLRALGKPLLCQDKKGRLYVARRWVKKK
ncbi:MAG: hypothetical protein Q7T16_01435 [Candidatus Burarchaeum sp.]|nr:hypothetical protein [Candidatus Burarchaeum sp.]MDO8339299.1 hypothetical protein [Candidatus Burarchaeum sp.]